MFTIQYCMGYTNVCSNSSGIAYYVLLHYLDPDDFRGEIQTFNFPANVAIVCRSFQIEDDSIALEGNEGFNVMITAVSQQLEETQPVILLF